MVFSLSYGGHVMPRCRAEATSAALQWHAHIRIHVTVLTCSSVWLTWARAHRNLEGLLRRRGNRKLLDCRIAELHHPVRGEPTAAHARIEVPLQAVGTRPLRRQADSGRRDPLPRQPRNSREVPRNR